MKTESVNLPFEEKLESQDEIIKDYTSEIKPVETLDFSKFIRDKLKEYNEDYNKEIKIKDLATIVGFDSPDVFKQTLNKRKKTNKRDCIIAICISLQLLEKDINYALYLYDMPILNKEDPRDKVIIQYIKESVGKDAPELSIRRLNLYLIDKGKRELDIHNNQGNKRKDKSTKEDPNPYKILKVLIHTPFDVDYYYGDPYNSLCTKYSPYRCNCTGNMYIYEPEHGRYFKLSTSANGCLSSQEYYKDKAPASCENYDGIDSSGVFKGCFKQLLNATNTEKTRLLEILNDTKNYSTRASARVINDLLCVFVEEYNYVIPEFNEYYVLQLADGKYTLSVYEKSAFMHYYLSSSEYEKTYVVPLGDPKEKYDSLEQIDSLIENSNKRTDDYSRLRLRRKEFIKLKPIVDELLQKIKSHEVYIQNPQIYDNEIGILEHYHLESDFEMVCKEEEFGEVYDTLPEKEYILPNGQRVKITIEDLSEAFSLGLKDIDEICRIKNKHKVISNLYL